MTKTDAGLSFGSTGKFKAHVVGAVALRDELKQMKAQYPGWTRIGTRRAAEKLLEWSKLLVPVDTGRLRRSGKVVRSGNQINVIYDTPYAARQHEDLTLNHPNGGQAKFLEQPLLQRTDELVMIIVNYVRSRSKK